MQRQRSCIGRQNMSINLRSLIEIGARKKPISGQEAPSFPRTGDSTARASPSCQTYPPSLSSVLHPIPEPISDPEVQHVIRCQHRRRHPRVPAFLQMLPEHYSRQERSLARFRRAGRRSLWTALCPQSSPKCGGRHLERFFRYARRSRY
jgi:hypothetical protein